MGYENTFTKLLDTVMPEYDYDRSVITDETLVGALRALIMGMPQHMFGSTAGVTEISGWAPKESCFLSLRIDADGTAREAFSGSECGWEKPLPIDTTAMTSTQFIAARPYDGELEPRHAFVYDCLIQRLAPHTRPDEDVDSLTERAGFLIEQGVVIEVIDLEFEDTVITVVDLAFVPDAFGMTGVGEGGDHQFTVRLEAKGLQDAIEHVTTVMLLAADRIDPA